MEVVIKDCADNSYAIEVGVDDTTETMRQKVASAVGLAEDSFHMGFGGKEEGDDITQLSAGDAIILTKAKKEGERRRASTGYPRETPPSSMGGGVC